MHSRLCSHDWRMTQSNIRGHCCASMALLIKQTFHPHNSNVWTERARGVGAGRGFPLLIGWLLVISERQLDKGNWTVVLSTVWEWWRGMCASIGQTVPGWRLFLLVCLLKNDKRAKRTRTSTTHSPLPYTYLQEKLIHSVNSLSNKAN